MKSRRQIIAAAVFGAITGAFLVLSDGGRPGGVNGPVTHVRDGDTIEVSGVPVRLEGLNCEERGSPLGESATIAITRLVRGKEVSCDLTGEKTYDREVGRCKLPDGTDIGSALISQRQCGRCARYDRSGEYLAVQRQAGTFRGKTPGYCIP